MKIQRVYLFDWVPKPIKIAIGVVFLAVFVAFWGYVGIVLISKKWKEQDAERKRKNTVRLVIVGVLLLAAGAALLLTQVIIPNREGAALVASGKFDEACALYEGKGWENKARDARFRQGEALMAAGDYRGAMEAFAQAGDIDGAREKWQEAGVALGRELADAACYEEALDVLDGLGEDCIAAAEVIHAYPDLQTLAAQQIFRPGREISIKTNALGGPWYIMACDGDRALFQAIWYDTFSSSGDCFDEAGGTDWATCTLREHMNAFCEKNFSERLEKLILETELPDAGTRDRLLLLDADELLGYCVVDGELRVPDSWEKKSVIVLTRTPGDEPGTLRTVRYDGKMYSRRADDVDKVYPAFWFDVKTWIERDDEELMRCLDGAVPWVFK